MRSEVCERMIERFGGNIRLPVRGAFARPTTETNSRNPNCIGHGDATRSTRIANEFAHAHAHARSRAGRTADRRPRRGGAERRRFIYMRNQFPFGILFAGAKTRRRRRGTPRRMPAAGRARVRERETGSRPNMGERLRPRDMRTNRQTVSQS